MYPLIPQWHLLHVVQFRFWFIEWAELSGVISYVGVNNLPLSSCDFVIMNYLWIVQKLVLFANNS